MSITSSATRAGASHCARSVSASMTRAPARGGLFRQGAAEVPQLLPLRDVAVTNTQGLLGCHSGTDRLDLRRCLPEIRALNVGARRAPAHDLDIERLSCL